MEPLNCVAQVKDGGCEIWNGEQLHTPDQGAVAKFLGLKPEQVKINMLFAGGSFGRRGNPHSDYVLDTVAIAQAGGKGKPVKLVWSREDDMRAGFYRPAYYHSLKAGLDKAGKITSWQQRIVGQSIMAGTILDNGAPIDSTSVEGASNLPYGIPNLQVELHTTKIGVPIQWWRSVGSTHTAYAVECFLDDIARATRQDPVALRRELLANQPRHLAVLNAAAEKSGWGKPLPAGTARGIALHEVLQHRGGRGRRSLEARRQLQGGPRHLRRGLRHRRESRTSWPCRWNRPSPMACRPRPPAPSRSRMACVQQSNFHEYTVLRMNQMPKVDVHIMPSTNKPTGVGEPGTPPIGPAVANALAVLTGKTYHTLPLSSAGVTIV